MQAKIVAAARRTAGWCCHHVDRAVQHEISSFLQDCERIQH